MERNLILMENKQESATGCAQSTRSLLREIQRLAEALSMGKGADLGS
jgi:hypothetical protein